MNKFNLISKKFNKKISVSDIKQYLVEEFNINNELQNQVYNLQDELKVAKEYEVKYNSSLATLDEYKSRIEKAHERNKHLENQIEKLQKTIKEQSYEIANLKLENKKYKELTDRINQFIKNNEYFDYKYDDLALSLTSKELAELKGILKEVEHD